MSERDRIEIDFAKASAQADNLEKIAGLLSNLAKEELGNAFMAISGIWRGDNADEFLKKGKDYVPSLLNTADELMKVAENVRCTAEIVYRAERKAAGYV